MNVLITSGGTQEPIDGVRSITNFSSGKTGAAIADYFADKGACVTLLRSEHAAKPLSVAISQQGYVTTQDLQAKLMNLLKDSAFDVVIHAAAVSDFHVSAIIADGKEYAPNTSAKLKSGGELLLRLTPNPKLIQHIKNWAQNPDLKLVGFKLTRGADEAEAMQKIQAVFSSGADYVVHNELGEISDLSHHFHIHCHSGCIARGNNKAALAETLYHLLISEGKTLCS